MDILDISNAMEVQQEICTDRKNPFYIVSAGRSKS